MMRSLSRAAALDSLARDGAHEVVGAVGDDVESLARLQKTVTALAHVHAIRVRLRARADAVHDVDSDNT